MLLAIDVGNTQTVIGLFGPEAGSPDAPDTPPPDDKDGDLVDHWRIVTVAERTSDELALLLRQFLDWHGVSPMGEYLGGAIIPGIEVSMDALFGRAAGLRKVELVPPRNVIGKSTVESIQSGAIHGFTGQVDHLVRCFEHELGDCTVVATGGLAALIAPLSTTIQHQEPWLTLYGLRIVFERNR